MKKVLIVVALSLFGVGCSGGSSPAESDTEIRAAINRYLSTRTGLDLNSMQVIVDNVEYKDDSATASVTIQATQDERAKMQMVYNLRKQDGRWEVEPSEAAAGHGGMGGGAEGAGAMPPGHPQTNPPAEQGGDLPSGHPQVGGEAPAPSNSDLPSGHPPVEQ